MASDADAAEHRKKKLRRVKFKLGLTGSHPPMLPPPPVEYSTKYADEDGVLELVPEGTLYTQHSDETGKMVPLPDEWLTRYCFHVRIDGAAVELEQVADKYGHRQPFSLNEPPYGLSYGNPGPVRLEIGKPRSIIFNVPGGGPIWILEILGIE